MNATSNTNPAVSKMVKLWESKNAQRALKGSGLTLMAMSLTACGSDSDTAVVTPVTPVTPVGATFDLTPLVDIASGTQALNGSLSSTFRFTDGNETVNGMTATMESGDTLLDPSSADADVLNVTLTGATTITTSNIETINLNYAVAAADFTGANTGTTAYNISGSVAGVLSTPASTATINLVDYTRVATVEGLTLTGTTAAGSAETISLSVSGATYGTTAATQTGVTIDGTDGEQLEVLNIASTGSSANTFALAFQNTETVGKYVITGDQDLNIRVADAKVSGATIDATANTGNVGINLATAGGVTVNAANWTGVDDIVVYDTDTTAGAMTLNSVASGQDVVVKNSVTTLTVAPVAATYSSLAAKANLELNSTSTTGGVTVTTYAVQNVTALDLVSTGLASSTSTTAANTITNLDGDFSTITITGDTSLKITDLDIEAVETASTTTARAVTVDASAMTGNAFVDITASADAKVSYTITGTAGADTLVANNSGSSLTGGAGKDTLTGGNGVDTINGGDGADTITLSFGADKITGGAGNETYDVNAVSATAVAQVITSADTDAAATTVAAEDDLVVTVNGSVYHLDVATDDDTGDDIAADFVALHGATILAAHGVTVATTAVTANSAGSLLFTGKSDGTTFTADVSFVDDGTVVAMTETATTAGSAAKALSTTFTDFASGDIIDTVGITALGTGGYYEGASTGMTAGTDYGVVVLTNTSYASSTAAATAINVTSSSGTDAIVVYLDSTTGKAEAYFDDNIGGNDTAGADIFAFDNITNLTDLAAAFSTDSFVI